MNSFSAASLALAFVALLPFWQGAWPKILGAIAAALSLSFAAYRAWRKAVLALPQTGRLSIRVLSATFASPIDQLLPASPARFDIRCDASNPSAQPLDLAAVEVVAIDTPCSFLIGMPVAKLFGKVPHWGPALFPLRFQPLDRRLDLTVFVELAFRISSPEEFARELGKSKKFSIKLRWVCENPSREQNATEFEARGDFSNLQAAARGAWGRSKRADLIAEMDSGA
ncbi:MAG: hypothetical protein R2862_03370 [Thermoanaerobaculia bacterium]